MKNKTPVLIEESNLSYAWARAFLQANEKGVNEISPLILILSGFTQEMPDENEEIRKTLDVALRARHKSDCHTVANTIFPASMWNRTLGREDLFARYRHAWPGIRANQSNRHGTYFQRMISYDSSEMPLSGSVNQLEHVISTYRDKGNHRISALQIAIFDPHADHTDQRQRGFPCLQHVFFTPDQTTGELSVTGMYARQYLFEKAYGNYLGLCRLGKFVAHELGLRFTRMICHVSVASLGSCSKRELQNLASNIEQLSN